MQAPEPQAATSLMASSEAPKQVDGSLLIAEDRNVGAPGAVHGCPMAMAIPRS